MSTLYRKYRPARWNDVAGQRHIKLTLAQEVATGKIAHAYIFAGPRGVGKTTTARIFSKAINCLNRPASGDEAGEPCGACANCASIADNRSMDIIEIDAASNRGIDNVRDNIIENARFSPAALKYKVFIIDEVHMLTTEAFNALLKTLEEPPAHAIFILATTELHKVPATILSRCQRFDFRKIPFADLVERLAKVIAQEEYSVDAKTIDIIARNADGCLRDAESLLGQILSIGDGKSVTHEQALVVLPSSNEEQVGAYVGALLRRDVAAALGAVARVAEDGGDFERFATDIVAALRLALIAALPGGEKVLGGELDPERVARVKEQVGEASAAQIVRALELLVERQRDIRYVEPEYLPLEIVAARVCTGDVAATAAAPVVAAPKVQLQPAPRPVVAEPAAVKTEAPVPAPAPAVEVAVAAPEPPRPTGPAVVSMEAVRAAWQNFVRLAGEANHGLPILLMNAEPKSVEGDIVCIGFAYSFHLKKFNDAKTKPLFEQAFREALGVAARLEGALLEKNSGMLQDDAGGTVPAVQAAPQPVGQPATGAASLANAFGGQVVQ